MKLKDILKQFVNEDGVIIYDDIDFDDIDDIVNNEIGKIVSKTRKSERAKQETLINNTKQQSEELQKNNSELENKVDQMFDAFNQLMENQRQLVTRDKERELREQAKEHKINEKVIDMLKEFGADLTKVNIDDLDDFKVADIEIESTPEIIEDQVEDQVEEENKKLIKEQVLKQINNNGWRW